MACTIRSKNIFCVLRSWPYKSFNFLEFTISILCNAELRNRPHNPQKEMLSVNSTAVSKQFTVPLRVSSGYFFFLCLPRSRSSQRKRRCDLNRFSIADARYILVKIESRNFGDFAKSTRYRYRFFRENYAHFPRKVNHFKMFVYDNIKRTIY